jgi:hypothetical protein
VVRHGLQEAVTPQKGGVFADPTADGSLSDGKPFDESLRVVFPALGFAQLGQGVLVSTVLVRRHSLQR